MKYIHGCTIEVTVVCSVVIFIWSEIVLKWNFLLNIEYHLPDCWDEDKMAAEGFIVDMTVVEVSILKRKSFINY
jgi:hypothetical protein